MKNKLSKESKRFYERELRQYWKDKKKLYNFIRKTAKLVLKTIL